MKKLFFALVCVFETMLVTSCVGSATPADAAADCIELLKAQDFESIVESMHFGDMPAEEQAQAKEMYVAMFNEKGAKQLEKQGGISSYALVSEENPEDGQTAVVNYDITYGDGTTKTQKFDMVLVDGEWKHSAKK